MDFGDGIRLFHVAAQFGKYFIEGHTYADSQPQFLTAGGADLLRDFHACTQRTASCDIQPALVHAEELYQVGVTIVDGMGQL